jgi:hypothetical protein
MKIKEKKKMETMVQLAERILMWAGVAFLVCVMLELVIMIGWQIVDIISEGLELKNWKERK